MALLGLHLLSLVTWKGKAAHLPCRAPCVYTLAPVPRHNYFKFLNSGLKFCVLFSKLYENPDQSMKLVLRDGFSVSRSAAISIHTEMGKL